MYKENWILVKKSDRTPHEFSRCAPGRTADEVASWEEDTSDAFQIEVETVECQNSAVAQELAKVRIDIFYHRKFVSI